jgi:iron complex outermembrane recepter protein
MVFKLNPSRVAVASLAAMLTYPCVSAAEESEEQAPAAAPAESAAPAEPAAPEPTAASQPATPVATPAAQPAPNKEVEEILVTGSRVHQKDLNTPAPVTILGKDQLLTTPKINVGDLLQQLPSQGNATNTAVNNGGDGTTQVNLRSIGANRTLVLVDGKRFVAGGLGADATVDLATIPTAAIERIEVLKDGASALYGSDAIGGVVNIITKKHVNGVEASAYEGISQRNDANNLTLDVLGGAENEQGSFMVNLGYFKQEKFMAANRSWAKYALDYDFSTGIESHGGSGSIPQGRFVFDPSSCTNQLCRDLTAKYGAGRGAFMYDPSGADTVNGWRAYDPNADAYNYQAVNYLVTPIERFSIFANGDYKVLNDLARVYLQGSLVNKRWANMLAPEPFNQAGGVAGIYISGDNAYNPFGTDIYSFGRRLTELNGRSQASDMDTFRLVWGIDGTLPSAAGPLAGWYWDFSFNFGRTAGQSTTTGSLNTQLSQQGVGPSYLDGDGTYQCGSGPDADGNAPYPGCVPVNLFGGPGSITKEMLASLGAFTGIAKGWNQQKVFEANFSGDLFTLKAKQPVALAFGAQWRAEDGGYQPNPLGVLGYDFDYSSLATDGGYSAREGYAELNVPIIDNTPWAEEVSIDAAVRYADFYEIHSTTSPEIGNNAPGSVLTYKVGGRYTPMSDVTVRGTFSTGFRAPNAGELFSGTQPSFPNAVDPCAYATSPEMVAQCGAAANNGYSDTQQKEIIGGSAALKPEKSTMFTVGVVAQPHVVENLAVTLDFYSLKITDTLGAIGTPTILAGCYPGPGGTPNEKLCSLVHREPNSQSIDHVDDLNVNLGSMATSGVDLGVRYMMPTDFGRFGLAADANFLIKLDQVVENVVIKGRNTYDLGVNPTVKANIGLSYALNAFSADLFGRYVGGFHECAAGDGSNYGGVCFADYRDASGALYAMHEVPQYFAFDLNLGYQQDWGEAYGKTTISGGIQNVLDTNPPVVYNSFLSYADPSAYDFLGRYFYLRLAQRF